MKWQKTLLKYELNFSLKNCSILLAGITASSLFEYATSLAHLCFDSFPNTFTSLQKCSLSVRIDSSVGHRAKTFRVVLTPLHSFNVLAVSRVVVLLKDELSPQSQVKTALEQVCIKMSFYIAAFICPTPDESP